MTRVLLWTPWAAAPGIYSARYGGPGLTDADRTNLLLKEMKNVPPKERTARFVCAMALVVSPEEIYVTRGECEGEIAFSPYGENGFGYDPVFFVPDFNKTFSQMSADEKNQISHRKRALEAMAQKIKEC